MRHATRAVAAALLVVSLVIMVGTLVAAADQKLVVWLNDYNNDTRRWWYTQFYPAWQKAHPDVEIDVYWQGWDDFTDKLTAATAGGEAPDVFQPGAEFVWSMAQNGFALPLDAYWAKWGKLDDYFPMTLGAVRFGGHLYGVPVLSAPRTLLVRSDVLAGHGFAPGAVPRTWDAFERMAVALTDGDDSRITALGTDLVFNFHKYLAFLWQNGGRILSADQSRVELDSPAAVEALDYLVQLNRAVVQGRTVTPGLGFRQGTVAIQYDSQYGLKRIAESYPDQLQNVIVADPLTQKAQATPVFTDWLAISRQSKHPDLAWAFITFFSQPEHLARYDKSLFFIPPSKGAVKAAAFLHETPGLLAFTDVMLRYGRPVPSYPSPGHLDDVLNQAIAKAISGKLTAQAALKAAAVEFKNVLAR